MVSPIPSGPGKKCSEIWTEGLECAKPDVYTYVHVPDWIAGREVGLAL